MVDESNEQVRLARERTQLASERNRLAAQRTYLAWTRTGLGCVAAGLTIIRFLTFQNNVHQVASQVVGCILVILGIAIFGASFLDFRATKKRLKLEEDHFASSFIIHLITIVLISVSIVLLLIAFKFTEVTFFQ